MNCIGVNYKKVPLEIRERYAFSAEEQREFHKRLKISAHCAGSVIVSTCNRSEIYFCGKAELIAGVERELAAYKELDGQEMLGQIYVYSGDAALRHLFHVTCGLDSMVLGEDEILRQVKEGYLLAQEAGAVCNEINIAFQGAMSSAKSIKTNTLLSKTPVSVGTLAANRIESFLKEQGTGKIGGILAKNLYDKGITEITGTSRRHGMISEGIGGNYGGSDRIVSFADRYAYVDEADVIVSATTGPHYTFVAQKLAVHIKTAKPRLFVDLAVPRDIDRAVAELAQCELVDVDDFTRAAAHNNEIKLHEKDKAELILTEKLEETKKSIYMSDFMEQNGRIFAKWKDRNFESVFYRLKDRMTAEQLKGLMEAIAGLEE